MKIEEMSPVPEKILDNLLPKCILCKEVPNRGIAGGFLLTGQFICTDCEEKLLTLEYDDPTYNMMVQKLKEVIYGYGPKRKNPIKDAIKK